jgi:hypothetical protein
MAQPLDRFEENPLLARLLKKVQMPGGVRSAE